jgi:hypothetical protein
MVNPTGRPHEVRQVTSRQAGMKLAEFQLW